MRAFAVLSLLLALLASSHAHMWLRTPLARGGLNDIGGTTSKTAPACLKSASTGTTTSYEAGDKVVFQFRVNQHGPGPFNFTLYSATNTVVKILAQGLPNTVTAGPDAFNGVNTPITLPTATCTGCYVMLTGMADAAGNNPWVNCANVNIVPVGSLGVPKVTSVNPATGPNTGGTTITVTGSSFGTTNPTCYFDKVATTGVRVSNTTVTCTSPPRNQPSDAAVELSFNGGKTISTSGTTFTYTGTPILPTITSISPSSAGPNTQITITGSKFYSADMKCKFSIPNGANVYTDATATSQTTATCLSPPTINGQINFKIEVSVDGSDYSQSGLVFAGSSTGTSSATTLLPTLSWLGGLALLLVALF